MPPILRASRQALKVMSLTDAAREVGATAEGVLLSLGLVVVVIGIAASVGGLLHHAFAGINAWVASVNLR
jgi:hypothetical protein